MTHADYLHELSKTYFGRLLMRKIEPRQWTAYIRYYLAVIA